MHFYFVLRNSQFHVVQRAIRSGRCDDAVEDGDLQPRASSERMSTGVFVCIVANDDGRTHRPTVLVKILAVGTHAILPNISIKGEPNAKAILGNPDPIRGMSEWRRDRGIGEPKFWPSRMYALRIVR